MKYFKIIIALLLMIFAVLYANLENTQVDSFSSALALGLFISVSLDKIVDKIADVAKEIQKMHDKW